jgi:hypothetical protein
VLEVSKQDLLQAKRFLYPNIVTTIRYEVIGLLGMKGVIFTEFFEMVEREFGMQMLEQIIDETSSLSGGSYTSVGTYAHTEMVGYAQALSRNTNTPVPDLVRHFGNYLAGSFHRGHSQHFDSCTSLFDMLKNVEEHIHVDVRKLYPDAELPVFSYQEVSERLFILDYESTRGFADLAQGLIEGVAKQYQEKITIARADHMLDGLHKSRFTITLL